MLTVLISPTVWSTHFSSPKTRTFIFQVSTPLSGEMLLSHHFCFSFFFWPDNLGVVPCFFPPASGPAWVWQNFRGLGHIHRGIDPSNKAVPRESWVRVWSLWTGRTREQYWEVYKTQLLGANKKRIGTFWKHFLTFFGTNDSKVVGQFVVCCFRNQFSNNKFPHFKHQTLSWVVECDRFVIISTSEDPGTIYNVWSCVFWGS